tara:strand:- start:5200 stop:5496 length:297 start_codon:yes stop_codon:yes gene_type:complete
LKRYEYKGDLGHEQESEGRFLVDVHRILLRSYRSDLSTRSIQKSGAWWGVATRHFVLERGIAYSLVCQIKSKSYRKVVSMTNQIHSQAIKYRIMGTVY